MTVRLRIPGVALALALSVTLVACTAAPVLDPLPEITVEPLRVPDSMVQHEPYLSLGGSALPATADLPFAFGGSVIEPGKAAVPAVWLSEDGTNWKQQTIDAKLKGSFFGKLAGSDTLAALGGTVWKDRALTSKLWVSKDRASWSAIALPDDFVNRYRIVTLSVLGTRVLAIGQAADGEVAGIAVSGTKVTDLALPTPAKGELLFPSGIVGDGDNLVLLAQPGPEGDRVPTVGYRSDDGGASWSKDAAQIAGATSSVSGIVWTGTTFVATGRAPASEAAGASSRPSAWSSSDGKAWASESIPAPPEDGEFFLLDIADAWLSTPSTAGGMVTTIAGNANSAVSALYQRSPEGAWSFGGTTSANQSSGGGGTSIPVAGGGAIALLGGNGYLRSGMFSGGSYTEGATLAKREFLNIVNDAYPGPDRELLVLQQREYIVGADFSWRNTSHYGLAEYTGKDAVSEVPWDPERLGALLNITMATDESGAEVVIGSAFPDSGSVILAQGFYRAGPDAEWATLRGFDGAGATAFSRVIRTESGWTAIGDYRTESTAGTPSHALVWSSTDGLNWSRAGGDFGDGPLESAASDACLLPNGSPITVGWVEESTGSFRMAAWSPSGDSWGRVDLGTFGDREGFATSCASDEEGVVVAATIGGRDVLLHTTDGTAWKQVFKAERGLELSSPVAVPGGFAAAGSWSNDSTAGAVVWLSRDGISWKPVSIPSRNSGSTDLVAAHGKDLIVTMTALGGDPVLVIRNIEKAIDQLLPQAKKG